MEIRQPVEGVFLDIGYTMVAPAGRHWMAPPLLTDFLDTDTFRALPQERVADAYARANRMLEAHHLILTEEAAVAQFVDFYTLLAKALPELGATEANIQAFARERILSDDIYRLYDDVPEALARLSKKFRLGIISDTWPDIPRVLRHFGILDCFQSVTYSYALGVFKPHPAMYRHAIETMGLAPERTVFVDDLPSNLNGAAAAGIQPVLIVRGAPPEEPNRYPAVTSLAELADLLGA